MSTLHAVRAPRLLRHYLLRWALGVLLLIWLAVVAQAWSTAFREARKFSDGQLVAVARLWLVAAPTAQPAPAPALGAELQHEFLQDVAVLAWDGARLVTDTHGLAPGLDLRALPSTGFATVELQRPGLPPSWRTFAARSGEGESARRVLVLMDMAQRHELGKDIAEHVAQPAVLLLPLALLLLGWAVRRGLRPLDSLSQEVAALDGFAGQRLDSAHRFREFASTVTAINTLVDTLQTRAQRERAFASDVAHELRTPLAALALQARAAQHEPTAERLQDLEQQSLRAGRILQQLLDLARAQRSEGGLAHGAPVALAELAATLVAAHAPAAHDSGHELSLLDDADGPLRVQAPPLLLELALRNLIDNALRHTPAGTQVLVRVWRDASSFGVSVSDDGRRGGPVRARAAEAGGLGLGLRLVERIAEPLGARLEADGGEPPLSTRFTLRWPRS